jgi:hypothetical protein
MSVNVIMVIPSAKVIVAMMLWMMVVPATSRILVFARSMLSPGARH